MRVQRGADVSCCYLDGGAGERICGDVRHIVRGHSHLTKDTRIPSIPGRSTAGFHLLGGYC